MSVHSEPEWNDNEGDAILADRPDLADRLRRQVADLNAGQSEGISHAEVCRRLGIPPEPSERGLLDR